MAATETAAPAGQVAARHALPQLVAHAAHELNNHLTTILGKAEIGLMLEDPPRWRRSLEEVLEAGHQARALVADVQRLVNWRHDGGAPTPLADLLPMAVRMASPLLRRTATELRADSAGGHVPAAEPGALLLTLWLVLVDALERDNGAEPRHWSVGGFKRPDGACGVQLTTSAPIYAVATVAELHRAQRLRDDWPGPLGGALALVREQGGWLELAPDALRICFRAQG